MIDKAQQRKALTHIHIRSRKGDVPFDNDHSSMYLKESTPATQLYVINSKAFLKNS